MIDETHIRELLRMKDKYLYHREGQELEFKEQFNLAGLADYFRDFAAFANNRGGYLVFGVKDSPRVPNGLRDSSLEQFEKIDPEKITGYLLEIFSSDILWEQATVKIGDKSFGAWRVHGAQTKPIIAKKNEGKDQIIKNGEIYYRYAGRTQKIQFAELESIINRRIEQNNNQWLDLMKKIGSAGPQNAAILDTEKSLIEKDESRILVLDEDLAQKLKFIKEGQFVQKDGAATLRLIGDVIPVDKVEVVKKVKEDLLKAYPYTATQLADEIKTVIPSIARHVIWKAIAENGLKQNADYAVYIFPNNSRKIQYEQTGDAVSAPSIYNQMAIDFLINVLKEAGT
ncbi:MAG: ATP-binding protein [Deltaproteobacteria bacterium]|nr:ATP-binding protein [Deltaproteobacteria bacterium]